MLWQRVAAGQGRRSGGPGYRSRPRPRPWHGQERTLLAVPPQLIWMRAVCGGVLGPLTVGSRPPAGDSVTMIPRIVILGGGTAGTLTANRLRREFGDAAAIAVADRNNNHLYQPGLLFVPFGLVRPDRIVRPRARQLRPGIGYYQSGVDHVDIERREVHLEAGTVLPYDV